MCEPCAIGWLPVAAEYTATDKFGRGSGEVGAREPGRPDPSYVA